jgi:aldehyde:ferredoxin oxidoreductase
VYLNRVSMPSPNREGYVLCWTRNGSSVNSVPRPRVTRRGEMKEIIGSSRRILSVDLTERKWEIFEVEEEVLRLYLGGKGMGLKLYYDRLKGRLAEVDPLGPKNILCFTTGLLAGTGAVCSARFSGVTKSPLTGIMVSSSCGGPFGGALRTAGYEGLIISGASNNSSSSPMVLEITDAEVLFKDAGDLWGKGTKAVQEELAPGKKDGALCIGPAGENKVLYANIASGERFLGRAGMGAVMGAKGLKAVLVRGGAYRIKPEDPEKFKRATKRGAKYINRSEMDLNMRNFGTAYNVTPGLEAGYLPVRNFKLRTDPRFAELSGEAMAKRYDTKPSPCVPCTIRCGHKASFPDGTVKEIPEYETVGVFGGNLENYDSDLIGEWNDLMNDLGMDTISAGVTLGWAMEAAEKGLRKSELAFGRTDNIAGVLEDIAYRREEGAELAEGTRRLSEKYGGKEFAIHVKGLELAAYDPRAAWGHGLNYAVANRGGCHLNAYPIGLEVILNVLNPYTARNKAKWVAYTEDIFSAMNSITTCSFTSYAYMLEPPLIKATPHFMLKLVNENLPGLSMMLINMDVLTDYLDAIAGLKLSMNELKKVGRRVHVLERYMNTRMGTDRSGDTLPGRFLTEAETNHEKKVTVPIEKMVEEYYREKGYDDRGIPKEETLRELEITL